MSDTYRLTIIPASQEEIIDALVTHAPHWEIRPEHVEPALRAAGLIVIKEDSNKHPSMTEDLDALHNDMREKHFGAEYRKFPGGGNPTQNNKHPKPNCKYSQRLPDGQFLVFDTPKEAEAAGLAITACYNHYTQNTDKNDG